MTFKLGNTACILSLLCAFTNATCIPKPNPNNSDGKNGLPANEATAGALTQTTTKPPIIKTTPLITEANSPFGSGIEGAGVDAKGNTYAVNFNSEQYTIGNITGRSMLYTHSDKKSLLNSIVFMPGTEFAFVADAANRRVLKLNVKSGQAIEYCHSDSMLQGVPNDMTLSKTGNLYLSGQKYQQNGTNIDGEVWLCPPPSNDGKVIPRKIATMGRTNGITLSPDEKTLYVSEAFNSNWIVVENKVWSFPVLDDGRSLGEKKVVIDFKVFDNSQAVDIDGMKTDTSGALYISRNGGGHVLKLDAGGNPVANITTSFKGVTNLEFGGKDGQTLYIVGKCANKKDSKDDNVPGCVDTVQVNSPGRMWNLLQKQ
jgi:sugar lactone lactonase YvrE